MRAVIYTSIILLFFNTAFAKDKGCKGDVFAVSETELYIDPKSVTNDTLTEGTYFRYDPWNFDHIAEYISPQYVGIKVDAMKNPSLTIVIKQKGRTLLKSKTYNAENRVYEGSLAGEKTRFQIFRLDKTLFDHAENLSRESMKMDLLVKGQGGKSCTDTYDVVIEDPQHAH